MSDWRARFIQLAQYKAQWSKDPSTKVGCVLVDSRFWTEVATGFNGFPRGVREEDPTGELDPARWVRPQKYWFTEHAERNAIYNAARRGHSTEGCWAFLNFDPDNICADCARALIQAGITRVYGPKGVNAPPRDGGQEWRESCSIAQVMFMEAGVKVLPYE